MTAPQVRRVLETALYCDDHEACARFYEALLGRERLLTGDRLIALDAGDGSVLLLFRRGASARPLETPGGTIPGHDGQGPMHLAFAIGRDEVGAWEARLTELHVALESRVRWDRGGESLYFRDPEGRSVELATPGTWSTW